MSVKFTYLVRAILSLVLGILAHRTDPMAIFIQHKWYRCHDGCNDADNCQRPVGADVLIHLDRGRTQSAGDDVPRKGHESKG